MKKKSMRILALALALVMLVSSSCITAFAQKYDYKTPYTDENGKYYFTYEQAGTYIMDLLDDLLGTMNNGMTQEIDAVVLTLTLRLQTVKDAVDSIYTIYDKIETLARIGIAGDVRYLDASALGEYPSRTDPNNPDYVCLYKVLEFLYDNRVVLNLIGRNAFNFGLLDTFGVLDDAAFITKDGSLGGYVANILYDLLEGDVMGKEKGASGCTTTDTVYNPDGTDCDTAVNELLIWFLNDQLGEMLDFPGGLGLTSNDVNINQTSFYDVFNNIIEAALNNLAVPLLTGVLMDALELDYDDQHPDGYAEQMADLDGNMIFGIVDGLLRELASTQPDYSGCSLPGEKVRALLQWFLVDGGMNDFILINTNGISIEDGFVELLKKVSTLAPDLLIGGLGLGTIPPEYYHSDEMSSGTLPQGEVYAMIINVLLSSLVQGYYCNPNATTIAEVGAYCLASLCARIVPEYNYMEQLEANYADGDYIGLDGSVVAPLAFTSTYTVTGQVSTASGWQPVTRNYTIPYAALDMGVTVGVFFLDGLLTANFENVPGPGEASATVRFEKFLKVLVDWAVNKYLPLFKTTYSLETKYPDYTSVWKEIDEILFGLIPSSWLPSTITDHTMGADWTTQGSGSSATITMDTTADLLIGWLIGSVLDFDLQQLFGIFSRNSSANAEFNQPIMTVVLRLIDRVFYVFLGKRVLLNDWRDDQYNKQTKDSEYASYKNVSRNAYTTPTSLRAIAHVVSGDPTGKDSIENPACNLLYNRNLGLLVYRLAYNLGGASSSFNANTVALPILSTALPLILSLEYVKPYRASNLDSGEITVQDLQNLVDSFGTEASITIPYVAADVDETTTGTYYTVAIENNQAVCTPVVLDGTNFDDTTIYYKDGYVQATDIDKFTKSASYNNGSGVFKKVESYTAVTLDGTNYDSTKSYFSPDFAVAVVNEKTNGTYFTAQNASSAVQLPEAYTEGTTYYYHPQVSVASSSTGDYFYKTETYSPVNLTGNGTNYNPNQNYYKKAYTTLEFGYMDAYNQSTGRLAMGVYTAGDHSTNGVGSYASSINGQQFYIYREQEDFPNALYSFNNFDNFIEDAEDYIGDYKNFIEDMKKDADEWKAFLASGDAKNNIPDTNYPFYTTSNTGIMPAGYTVASFNNLQAIKDFKAMYGESAFITTSTANSVVSGSHNVNTPMMSLPTNAGADTQDAEVAIYKGYKDYIKDIVDYSNKLNDYYDGINYYLAMSENNRKPYKTSTVGGVTVQGTTTQGLDWVLNKLCLEAYGTGENNNRYTSKSWAQFKRAYQAALDVCSQVEAAVSNYKTTQSMVTAVRSGLIEAFFGLKIAGSLADVTGLHSAIVDAYEIGATDLESIYTPESITKFQAALQASEAVYDYGYEADDQTLVDAQTAKLIAAINALEFIALPGLEVGDGEDVAIEQFVNDGSIEQKIIYGIAPVLGLSLDSFNVVGIQAANVSMNESTYGKGTGSTIVGKSAGNITKFRYIAVIFGDVNGDARIDGTDKIWILANTVSAANSNLDQYQDIAADIDGDGVVGATDALLIGQVANYEGTISQAAPSEQSGSRFNAI